MDTSTVNIVKSSSPAHETLLLKFQTLCRLVFEPETAPDQPPKASQLQLDTWRTRLGHPDAVILYVDNAGGDDVLAFFMIHPRPLVVGSETTVYHIYLAAVHPSARGKGLFPLLMEAAKQQARERDYTMLGVSTVPSRFERMYGILSKEGSGWEVVEWKDGDDGRRKVVFKMDL